MGKKERKKCGGNRYSEKKERRHKKAKKEGREPKR